MVNSVNRTYESNSPEETFRVGRMLAEDAQAGEVYALVGDLGVGKTVFTKGFAEGLGIDESVNSPTFTILQIYEEGSRSIISMSIGSRSPKRWKRSVLMSISTETVSV